jgi:hypothetical protein
MLMLLVFIAIVAVVYFMYQPKSASPVPAAAEYAIFGQGEYEEIGGDISEYDRDNVEALMDL